MKQEKQSLFSILIDNTQFIPDCSCGVLSLGAIKRCWLQNYIALASHLQIKMMSAIKEGKCIKVKKFLFSQRDCSGISLLFSCE